MKKRWLKKYTELQYAENVLKSCALYLGVPAEWPDKNDAELIKIYCGSVGMPSLRATCLTKAADRFHFWTVFGAQSCGICFWFDQDSLITDIKQDQSLIGQEVAYRKPTQLSEIPFTKRAQYSDEKEYRVLKHFDPADPRTSFSFSPKSLRRIYLNAWLTPVQFVEERNRLTSFLSEQLSHVEVKQSRTIRRKSWIDHAQRVATSKQS